MEVHESPFVEALLAAPAGVALLARLEQLAGGHIDHGGDEATTAPTAGRLHDRLVEADHGHRAHPIGVVDPSPAGALHR
jgi:hypothetical protein